MCSGSVETVPGKEIAGLLVVKGLPTFLMKNSKIMTMVSQSVSMKATNAVTKILYEIVYSNIEKIKTVYDLFVEYENLPKVMMSKYFKYSIIPPKQRVIGKRMESVKPRFITIFIVTLIHFIIYNFVYTFFLYFFTPFVFYIGRDMYPCRMFNR